LEALALFGTAHSKKNISETMFSLNFSMYGTEQMEGRCKPITTLANGNPLPGKLFYRRNGQSYPVAANDANPQATEPSCRNYRIRRKRQDRSTLIGKRFRPLPTRHTRFTPSRKIRI
jgi:hypothetical protein